MLSALLQTLPILFPQTLCFQSVILDSLHRLPLQFGTGGENFITVWDPRAAGAAVQQRHFGKFGHYCCENDSVIK